MTDTDHARWIRAAGWLLPRRYRAEVLDDLLDERAALVRAGSSRVRAGIWFVAHVIRSAAASRAKSTDHLASGSARMLIRDLGQDAALGFRLLVRQPRFTLSCLLTLALGIGAPSAIFSVVHGVLLRPLPYPEADRLVRFRIEGRGQQGPISFDGLPASTALAWIADSSALSSMALFNDQALTLSTPGGPVRLAGIQATPRFFDVLGVPPELGQIFDAASRDARLVVLSHATWQRHFAGDRAVVGSTVVLDSEPYLVAGVMPASFAFPTSDAAFWTPLVIESGGGRGLILPAIARLSSGATPPRVADEGRRVLESQGHLDFGQSFSVRTLQDQMVGGVRRLLWVLMAAVSFVFVIATSNIAVLLVTRGAGREREFSVRLALGAGRARLARQLLVESLVLAGLGGLAGVLLCALAIDALPRLAPPDLPRLGDVALDGSVLAFAAVLTLATSLIFGALSAGRAIVISPVRVLGRLGGDTHSTLSRASRRRLSVLAAVELALTTVLIVGATLLLRSFTHLLLVDQGFDHRQAVAARITLPQARYPSATSRLLFHERLLERLQHTAEFAAVGLTTSMPNRQPSARMFFSAAGIPAFPDPITTPVIETRTVSEGFFEAMGIPIRAGRGFQISDGRGAEPVVVISERLGAQQFPDRRAVGELVYSGDGPRRIVGVVGDVQPAAPGAGVVPAAYLPIRQDEMVFRWYATVTIVARGPDLPRATTSLQTIVTSFDPEMPVFGIRTLSDEAARLTAAPRFSAALVSAFAAIAFVLAAIGVFGVMAHGAALRTREIGVRIALGASRAQVMRLVFRDGLRTIAAGILAGLVAAAWLARTLTGLLHDVRPADPFSLASVAALLAVAGALAAYLPARRATRVSTVDALGDR